MPAGGDDSTGDRIARYRKLRGLTQRGLALRANVAYGTLTKVESGHAVAQPAVVAAVARALGIDVDRLTEAVEPGAPGGPSLDELVEPLRGALGAYDLPADDIEPRSVEAVAADVDAVCRRVMRDGVLAPVVGMLSGLLDELVALVHGHAARDPRAWVALAHAYRCVQQLASRLGLRDLGAVALDRMSWAAGGADDPIVEALRLHERAHEHLRSGQHHHAHRLQQRAESLAESAPVGAERAALTGHGHLAASVHAAQDGEVDAVEDHLARAGELATKVGEVPDALWLGFGPTNVALHEVAALVARERHQEAVDTADRLRLPSRFDATRVGHHHMDLGSAHAALGHHERALRALLEARRIAPQVTRFHPTTRRTVEQLLLAKRRVPESLAGYARWVGV